MNEQKSVTILGIETSCDETSAAVVVDGKKELSNVISSQIAIHQRYGGVVPEVASRKHIENILFVIEEALEKAGITLDDLDAIAVTKGPGLVGALLVGVSAAKAIAYARQIPLIGVHHIAGHIHANQLVADLQPPYIGLIVSGGHTELVKVTEQGYEILGQTLDDAVGEAFDKVARVLDLPYPGGPQIDQLAKQGSPVIEFPRAWLEHGSLDFSFSGLKSAVLNYINQARQKQQPINYADVAASFQASVIEVLVTKTEQALAQTGLTQVVVAGGVAANSGLRNTLEQKGKQKGWEVYIPPLIYCTDNAAMIAIAGWFHYQNGERSSLDVAPVSRLAEF